MESTNILVHWSPPCSPQVGLFWYLRYATPSKSLWEARTEAKQSVWLLGWLKKQNGVVWGLKREYWKVEVLEIILFDLAIPF